MRFSTLVVIAACLSCAPVLAEKGESIMFGDPSPSLAPETGTGDSGDRCQQLLNEIDALKGKPQRRMTAQQRYDAECRQDTLTPPPSPSQ